MGLLLDLYPRHTTAYIGGGFDKGIHNIAEPLLAGCRVVIGPHHNGDIYANKAKEEKLVKVVHQPSQIITTVANLYRTLQDVTQMGSSLDWIKDQGDLVMTIFDKMKSLY